MNKQKILIIILSTMIFILCGIIAFLLVNIFNSVNLVDVVEENNGDQGIAIKDAAINNTPYKEASYTDEKGNIISVVVDNQEQAEDIIFAEGVGSSISMELVTNKFIEIDGEFLHDINKEFTISVVPASPYSHVLLLNQGEGILEWVPFNDVDKISFTVKNNKNSIIFAIESGEGVVKNSSKIADGDSIEETGPKFRDKSRIEDVRYLQLALELYYNDYSVYPENIEFGSSIDNYEKGGYTAYLAVADNNPLPNDGPCASDFEYQYNVSENLKDYEITFCLGYDIDIFESGYHKLTNKDSLLPNLK